MIELMQLVLFFSILLGSFVTFAFILKSEAKRSGIARTKPSRILGKNPQLTMKKGY